MKDYFQKFLILNQIIATLLFLAVSVELELLMFNYGLLIYLALVVIATSVNLLLRFLSLFRDNIVEINAVVINKKESRLGLILSLITVFLPIYIWLKWNTNLFLVYWLSSIIDRPISGIVYWLIEYL